MYQTYESTVAVSVCSRPLGIDPVSAPISAATAARRNASASWQDPRFTTLGGYGMQHRTVLAPDNSMARTNGATAFGVVRVDVAKQAAPPRGVPR